MQRKLMKSLVFEVRRVIHSDGPARLGRLKKRNEESKMGGRFRTVEDMTNTMKHRAPALAFALAVSSTLAFAPRAAFAEGEGDVARGQAAFGICATCHTGQSGAIAPDLRGAAGRPAASDEDFPLYTPALKNSGLVWDDETLDRFLASPFTVAPGTTMAFPVANAQERADLIAYMKSLNAE